MLKALYIIAEDDYDCAIASIGSIFIYQVEEILGECLVLASFESKLLKGVMPSALKPLAGDFIFFKTLEDATRAAHIADSCTRGLKEPQDDGVDNDGD